MSLFPSGSAELLEAARHVGMGQRADHSGRRVLILSPSWSSLGPGPSASRPGPSQPALNSDYANDIRGRANANSVHNPVAGLKPADFAPEPPACEPWPPTIRF